MAIADRVKHAERARIWRRNNPDKVRAANKRCYQKNAEKNRLRARAYRASHPDAVRNTQRNYRKKNPGWGSVCTQKRRARKLENSVGANMLFVRQFYITARRISDCCGITMHVDHVIPLSKGGPHREDNLRVVPAKLNIQKHNKTCLQDICELLI